jgi:hypothetical protein
VSDDLLLWTNLFQFDSGVETPWNPLSEPMLAVLHNLRNDANSLKVQINDVDVAEGTPVTTADLERFSTQLKAQLVQLSTQLEVLDTRIASLMSRHKRFHTIISYLMLPTFNIQATINGLLRQTNVLRNETRCRRN